jgi:predicted membrane-bound spermidine synthase
LAALLAAALAGFAVLTVEILGIHLLAPWFGTSALVWSQQIGVVLLAMALGGWAGGRAARSGADPARRAALLLGAGGVLIAAGTLLLAPFARWMLPENLTLDDAARSFLHGSLAAALLFFAPPVFLLAMLSPLLVEVRARARGAGLAAGEIGAASTLGSLAGVFGSAFLALPQLGVRATLFLTCAALLAGAALLLRGRAGAAAGLLALAGAAGAVAPDPARAANLPAGARVLAVRDSFYQRLRVIEFEPSGQRWLQMNEGLDSFQSWWSPDAAWSGQYYDLFVLAPLCAGLDLQGTGDARPVRFWLLGAGTGSALPPLAAALEGRAYEGIGVELDPAVAELGREWMPLDPELAARVRSVTGADARSLLRVAPADLDFLLLDAYARQFEIPPHLATCEFFAECATHLRPGGVLAVNIGTRDAAVDANGLLARLAATVRAGFGPTVRLHRVPRSRNWILLARKDQQFPSRAELAERIPAGWPAEIGAALLPGQTVEAEDLPAAEIFTDERNALVLLQARSWRGGADQ